MRAPLGHAAVVEHHDGALNEIARTNPAAPGAGLVYEGAARMLLGSLVGTAVAARHTLLALSHQPFPSGTTRYKNSALTW